MDEGFGASGRSEWSALVRESLLLEPRSLHGHCAGDWKPCAGACVRAVERHCASIMAVMGLVGGFGITCKLSHLLSLLPRLTRSGGAQKLQHCVRLAEHCAGLRHCAAHTLHEACVELHCACAELQWVKQSELCGSGELGSCTSSLAIRALLDNDSETSFPSPEESPSPSLSTIRAGWSSLLKGEV